MRKNNPVIYAPSRECFYLERVVSTGTVCHLVRWLTMLYMQGGAWHTCVAKLMFEHQGWPGDRTNVHMHQIACVCGSEV